MIVCDSHWGDLAYEFMDELKEIVRDAETLDDIITWVNDLNRFNAFYCDPYDIIYEIEDQPFEKWEEIANEYIDGMEGALEERVWEIEDEPYEPIED